MSMETEANLDCSMEVDSAGSNEGDQEITTTGSEESVVLNQILLAPEIMDLILILLDFRSLKTARLVCKSWLRAAQFQMEKRGVVELGSRNVQQFLDTLSSQMPDFPQPFKSIGVNFRYGFLESTKLDHLSEQRSVLVMTRFSTGRHSLNLILPLIIRCSSSLEYLELVAYPFSEEPLPPMDPNHIFPKLQHLKINTRHSYARLSSVVDWIMGVSPVIETFESWSRNEWGYITIENELLLKVNRKQLRSHSNFYSDVIRAICKHFLPFPTDRSENLKMRLSHGLLYSGDAIVATVIQCTASLRAFQMTMDSPETPEFPMCPNVLELTLTSFGDQDQDSLIWDCFPSLQVLHIKGLHVDVLGDVWRDLSPSPSVKTLRVMNLDFEGGCDRDETLLPLRFFEKFPALERLLIRSSFVVRCCRLKATGDPKYSQLLEGVKHLELRGAQLFDYLDPDFSSLAVLKGLETITILAVCDAHVLSLVSQLPFLKVFQFPWNSDLSSSMDQLLHIARRVERVVIINCCKISWSDINKNSLDIFFESASNAECGCKDWEKLQWLQSIPSVPI